MPTFDFACTACGHVFEKTIAFGSKTKPACVNCGSKKTEKQLTPPAVHFKGTGFYRTDSASASVATRKTDGTPKTADTPKATETLKPAETPKAPDKPKPESTSKSSEK